MILQRIRDSVEHGLDILTDPRRQRMHGIIIAVALVVHLATHYATFYTPLRLAIGNLPYFRLHAIHEAEFLLIVAYAGIVFGLKGGLVAIAITAVSSIPFIFMPYFQGRAPQPNEIRDLALQVAIILSVGFLIVLLYDTESRRRRAETRAAVLLESNATKNEFLSIASHELRTPLTTLYGYSELLLTGEVNDERRQEWLKRIYKESGRLSTILDELLNVSRIQSGKLAVRQEKLDIAPIVEEMVEYVSATTNHHILKVGVPPQLPPVFADKDKLTQVLINFLSNAIKYSPKGGHITISAVEDPARKRLVISVSDQGIGIAPEDQAQLFTTFHRVRRPETVGVQGTGLGLYVVKSLVELMGGEVWLKSEVGKGSTFTFTLPLWQPDMVLEAEAAAA